MAQHHQLRAGVQAVRDHLFEEAADFLQAVG